MRVCLIRHAATRWNEDGRIQGRTDVPLSPAGRAQAAAWRLPPGFREAAACVASPLRRARETAEILGFAIAATDSRLAEMSWGVFEGQRLAELRSAPGSGLADLEAMGLDFAPPGGESPRAVADRLAAFLRDLARDGAEQPHLLVAHKGVLRAALVLALDWDMRGKPPVRHDPERALLLDLDRRGSPSFLDAVPLRDTQP
jgi:probable phosphoglycerate mutase